MDPNSKYEGQPPPYVGGPAQGYPPQPQTGFAPQPGFVPHPGYSPQPGYPPQAGYAPQPGYAPPPGQPGGTNVVVVGQPQPQQNTVIVQERQGVNHALHCIITLLFWPWIIVWIILCITEGS